MSYASFAPYDNLVAMKDLGQKFESLEAADRAEDVFYKNLSPNERVELPLQLVAQYREVQNGSAERFERVFRVVPLEES